MKTSMKRVLALILVAVTIIAGITITPTSDVKAAEKPGFTVKTSSSTVRPGDEISVELWLNSNCDMLSFAGNFEYDTNTFEMVGKKGVEGPVMEAAYMSVPIVDPGSISLLLDFDEPYNDGGLIYTITLKVKDNASGTGNVGFGFKSGAVGTDPDNSDTVGPEGAAVNVQDKAGTNLTGGNITVDVPVESVSLNKTEAFTMARGSEENLSVTAVPESSLSGKTIQWTSSNERVLTVDEQGKVKAEALGSATITATVGGKTASVQITVNAPLTGIQLNKETLTLKKGTSETLSVTYQPTDTTDDKTVTWESDDVTVATVDKTGKVTALKDGTANITATVAGKKATCVLTVKEVSLSGISLDSEKITVARDAKHTLNVIYNPEDTTDDKTIEWSSADESIATVENGVVTGKKIGTTKIKAMVGKHTAECEVTVNAPLTGLELNAMVVELLKREEKVVTVSFLPEDTTDSKEVTWSIENPEIATITPNADGTKVTVAGKKQGQTLLKVRGANQTEETCLITVIEYPITTIALTPEKATLEVGESVTCNVTYNPENTTDDKVVSWSSSDESIATVKEGVITAVSGGTATITAETENGAKGQCMITVPIHMTGIALNQKTAEILRKDKTPLKLTVGFEPENTTDDKTITWESSDSDVATVSESGEVFGWKAGEATITATSSASGLTDKCLVTVKEIPLEDIKISSTVSKELYKGMEQKLEVETVPENSTDDLELSYESVNEDIATVDVNGNVRALKEGTTEITVYANGKFSASYLLTVKEVALESISFEKEITSLEAGQTGQLKVIYNPENTTDDRTVIWGSSDTTIATVENGMIKALKAGKTIISAKVGEKEISYELTVVNKKVTIENSNGKKSDTVQTGDTTNVLPVIVTLLVSLFVIIGLSFRRKRIHR